MKKLFAALAALALCLALSLGASAEAPAYVLADDATLNAEQQELDIPVRISDNGGIMGFGLTLSYDKTLFEPVSVERGAAIPDGMLNDSIGVGDGGAFKVIWTGTSDNKRDGVLFTARFKVLATAFTRSEIKINFSKADTFDENYEDVVLECEGAVITGTRAFAGDANRDGVLNIRDATHIQKYLVGKLDETEIDLDAADIDGKKGVTIDDATYVQRALVGLENIG